jgi:hypothetical protein
VPPDGLRIDVEEVRGVLGNLDGAGRRGPETPQRPGRCVAASLLPLLVRMAKTRHVPPAATVGLLLALGALACNGDPPIGPTPICTFSLDPASRAFTSDAADGTVSIAASDPSCAWSTIAGADWVLIAAPASGVGSGSIRYTVTANRTAVQRATTIALGSVQHTITQTGAAPPPCTYAINPSEASVPSGSSTGQFTVTTGADCSWEAVSGADWIGVVSGGVRNGSGTVDYRVDANRRETPRAGTIAIQNQTFRLNQAGEEPAVQCEYAVTPVAFSPCLDGGIITARVNAPASCAWTVASNAAWLRVISGASGSGSADIRAEYSSNYDAPRLGMLLVRWPSPTAGQNVQVSQAGCRYGVSRSAVAAPASGGVETFDVLQQSEPIECGGATQDRCQWTAVTDVAWITITTSMPRTGDDRVSFIVLPNLGGIARTGTITVKDKQVIVTQAP